MEFFDHAETWDRAGIEAAQVVRLRNTVEQAGRCAFYAGRFAEAKITPADIRTPDDIRRIPFTTKDDLRSQYPEGLLCVPRDEIVRMHSSSGTTGAPTAVCHTRNDLNSWADLMARCMYMVGVRRSDVFQNMSGYGLFTGGLGAHCGVEKLGAAAIPASSGNTQRQITMLMDFGVTHLCCTPSYAMYIAEVLYETGHTKKDLHLKAGCFGAEPWSAAMRAEIEDRLGLRAHDIYGLSEIMGPSVSQDCRYQNGLHIWEDCYLPEITDPDTNMPVKEGEAGDLVITTINKEGIPLIRYKTRDICSLTYEKCACGRTHARMSKPVGRTDDMLIIRGVNVFPSQIESVLLNLGEIQPYYQIIVDRVNNLDTMTIEIEVSERMFSDHIKGIEDFEQKISRQMESALGLYARIRLVEPKSIARSEGKAKRVIDKRKFA